MRISKFFLYILILFIIMGCEPTETRKILHLPEPSEFQGNFQWFIEIFTPDFLTNPERVILLLLSVVVFSSGFGVINSNRLMVFLKKAQFNFFPFTWLLKLNSHPGWTFGVVISLIFLVLVVVLMLLFIVIFYLLTWLLPWVTFLGGIILILLIILFIIGVILHAFD
jgi:hypothetical protein